jgi:hypothetical protein
MNYAVNGLIRRQRNGNPHCATPHNVSTDPSNARGSGGQIERDGITSKRGQVDRASVINHPKLEEVTTTGYGG